MKYKNPTAAVYLVSTVAALSILGDGLLYSVLPLYAANLGIPLTAVGLILSINRWARLFTNPIAARSFNRFGITKPLFAAMVLAVLTTFIYSRPWGLVTFLVARVVWGLCWSLMRLGGFVVIMEASATALGFGIGVFHVLTRLGSAFTSFVGSFLVDLWGYKWGLTIMAALTSLGIPLIIALRKNMEGSSIRPQQGPHQEEGDLNRKKPELSPLVCNASGFATSFVGAGLLMSSISLILQQRIGDSVALGRFTIGIATISGLVLAVRMASNLFISPIVGKLIDRIGRKKPFLFLVHAMALLILAFATIQNPVITIALAFLLFFSGNAMEVILDAAIGDTAWSAADRNKRISQYTSFYDLGAATGPIVAYAIGGRLSFATTLYLGALLMVAVIGIYFMDTRTRQQVKVNIQ